MSDDHLRELERAYAESGDWGVLAQIVAHRVRTFDVEEVNEEETVYVRKNVRAYVFFSERRMLIRVNGNPRHGTWVPNPPWKCKRTLEPSQVRGGLRLLLDYLESHTEWGEVVEVE